MQHKALAPRQLAHSPFTPVKVMAKIQLESQTLPHLRVARMGVNLRLPLIPRVRFAISTFAVVEPVNPSSKHQRAVPYHALLVLDVFVV